MSDVPDPLRNPQDPLRKTTSENGQELLRRWGQASHDFPVDDVVNAATNVIINALRQQCATRQAAEKAFDELFGRTKSVLVGHYDSLGRKRGIFPYDQTIVVPMLNKGGV